MIQRLLDLPLYRLELPTPFPVGPVNVYLITEPEAVLLDTGTATADSRATLERLLGEAGLRPRQLKRIVVSHGHLDHYGLARVLAAESGGPVYAPALDETQFSHRELLEPFYDEMMEEAGVPPAVRAQIAEQWASFRCLAHPIDRYVPLEEMPPLRCGDLVFEPVPTPGHTRGATSFFEPRHRILLSSDTVLKEITPNPVLDLDESEPTRRFRALRAYLQSLDKLLDLNPAVIFTGHGAAVEDFAALHARVYRHHAERQEKLLDSLRRQERTVYDLAQCIFPDPRTHNSFLAISEIYAHLDLLDEAGRLRKELDGKVAVYTA